MAGKSDVRCYSACLRTGGIRIFGQLPTSVPLVSEGLTLKRPPWRKALLTLNCSKDQLLWIATAVTTLSVTILATGSKVKEYQEKDKIISKPDKNGKRGEARKSQKQLQWIKEEKLKKTEKEG
nr:hypothetical protein [Tanacetum cinerariifolium]